MNRIVVLVGLIFIAASSLAASTDGNYTLTQYKLDGGGSQTPDTNFASFLAAGETAVLKNTSDNNFALGAGFYADPFSKILVEVVAVAAEAAAQTIIMMIPPLGDGDFTSFALIALLVVFLFAVLFFAVKEGRGKGEVAEKGGEDAEK